MSKIALFGAAAIIGRSIAAGISGNRQLYRVRGFTKASLRNGGRIDPHVEIDTWNPDSPGSLQAATAGIGTPNYMVGVDYTKFSRQREVMRKTLAGASAAGVKNSVLISARYASGRAKTRTVRADDPREPHAALGKIWHVGGAGVTTQDLRQNRAVVANGRSIESSSLRSHP